LYNNRNGDEIVNDDKIIVFAYTYRQGAVKKKKNPHTLQETLFTLTNTLWFLN